jgi:hypothetical protein
MFGLVDGGVKRDSFRLRLFSGTLGTVTGGFGVGLSLLRHQTQYAPAYFIQH